MRWALVTVASIFLRLRTMRVSAARRSTSSSPNAATFTRVEPRERVAKPGHLASTTCQLRPDWNTALVSTSK